MGTILRVLYGHLESKTASMVLQKCFEHLVKAVIKKKENSVVFIGTYYSWSNMNWEFYENNNQVDNIQLPRIEQDTKIIYSNKIMISQQFR